MTSLVNEVKLMAERFLLACAEKRRSGILAIVAGFSKTPHYVLEGTIVCLRKME